jgi:thymidylate synthase (FAD)
MEHLVYTYYIQGISRALLQELARHRMASPSVKSTRYTLKELKEGVPFAEDDYQGAERFIVLTGNALVDTASIKALNTLQAILQSGVSNDRAKYCLPESYKTELTWTINARSLQNFLTLRSNKAALWEIRKMAYALYDTLPKAHQYLFEECLYNEGGETRE